MKWFQDKKNITIVIDARDLKNEKIEVTGNELNIDFQEDNKHYKELIVFKEEIDAEKVKVSKTNFCATVVIPKKNEGMWKSLTANDKAHGNLKVDWSHFVDSDDEKEPEESNPYANMGNMANMGGMGGMGGGMGGFPGMGGMGGFPGMGGMGGFPGMENLGGMGGDMGGMGDDEDDEENDGETEGKPDLDDLEGEAEKPVAKTEEHVEGKGEGKAEGH